MSRPLLELCNIHAAYLQKEVLRGVSLTVRAGEVVALLGENGSGKSTVLKIVAGILRPVRGEVRYRDRDLNGLGIVERQRLGIGYLMQGGRVFPNLTVQENFDLAAAQTRDAGREPVSFGSWFPILRDRHNNRAGLLSGGQRQMLAIEIVLAQRPQLLLLDEPTGALTEELSLQILSQVRHYVETHAAAAILVEHILAASDFTTCYFRLTHGVIASSNRS